MEVEIQIDTIGPDHHAEWEAYVAQKDADQAAKAAADMTAADWEDYLRSAAAETDGLYIPAGSAKLLAERLATLRKEEQCHDNTIRLTEAVMPDAETLEPPPEAHAMTQRVIGTRTLSLAAEGVWDSPAAVGVILHDRYTFNSTPMRKMIELKGLECEPETDEDVTEGLEEAVEMLTPADARALAALLLQAADAAEA